MRAFAHAMRGRVTTIAAGLGDVSPAGYAVIRHRMSIAWPITWTLIFGSAALMRYTILPDLPIDRIAVVCTAEMALLLPYRRWFRAGHGLGLLLLVQFVVDLGCFAFAFSGRPLPTFAPFMLLMIVVPASLASPFAGVGVTLLALVVHFAVAAGRTAENGLTTAEVFAAAFVLMIVAYQSVRYGRQLAIAATEARRESALSAALVHVAAELSAVPRSDAVAARLTVLARELTSAPWACLLLRDAEATTFRVAAAAAVPGYDLRPALGLEAPVAAHAQALLDAAGSVVDCPSAIHDALSARPEVAIAAPLTRGDTLLGVLIVGDDASRALPAAARRLLAGIARPAVLALDNARLVDDLRDASALKSEFVSTVSHELRSPLHAIIGYLDMGREELVSGGDWAEVHDMLSRARAFSLQLLDTIEATLDVGRIENGRVAVRTSVIALDGLVSEMMETVPAQACKNGVTLRWELDAAVTVEIDAPKVKTIVRNLVHNALKFTDAGSVVVHICAEPSGGGVALLRVRVSDTGIGIAHEMLPAIFEMFRQGDGSFTRRHDGIGLGLYIVKRLVETLDGTIAVQSDPGVGSTFTVSLPVGIAHPGSAAVGDTHDDATRVAL